MKEKKFVALSIASLNKVWVWCEENDADPLAVAYVGACVAVGEVDCSKIADRMKKSWTGAEYGWINAAYQLDKLAFQHRDTLGRAILEMLKRERKSAPKPLSVDIALRDIA